MYKVYADGVLIHDDNSSVVGNTRLISPSLSLKDNSAGAFTATIPVGNVCYDSIRCFDTTIDIFRHNQNGSDTWIWSGRPLKITKDFYNQKKLTTEGALAFLNDIVVPLGKLYRLDLPQYVRFLLDIYNMHVASNRRITAGGVSTISSTGKGTGFHDYEFDGDNVLSYLSKALEDWGLHARIRRTGNSYSSPGYVLDLVTDSQLPMSHQTVNFGKNLLDYTSDDDWSELVTAILPYGATIEEESSDEGSGSGEESGVVYDENDSSQQSQQSQQQEEDDAPKPKYTIFGLQPSNPKFYADGAYLVNRVMENIHGRIEQTVEWSDIKDPVELLALAEAYLNDYTYMTQKLTVKVIDLHYLTGSNEIAFDFLSQINCFSSIHGLNDTFIVKEMTIPFDNPENTSFTMNRETRGYYGADRKSGGGYSSKISATSWHIPAREGILRVARENAEALINMMTSGYVTLVPTEDGDHVWALTVTNGVDEASSTQMWKWTLGGLMFQERSSVSADWGLPNLALTMDGQIVATRITTGTLAIDDGQGGYLILANMDTGTLQIGSFDVTGTSIYNTKRSLDDDYTKGIYIGFDGIAIGEMNSGLFKVDVYNDTALIAGFNFNGDSIYKDKTSIDDDSVAGVYIGTDGISVGDESNGLFKVDTNNNTAFIAGFNFDDGSFYTNNRASLQGSGEGVYLGTDGISTGDANGLYTALANGYLSGGPGSESGYISFNTVNTANNQNGIRVAGNGCVAILTNGDFGVGKYVDNATAATFSKGCSGTLNVPTFSGTYKYYTYEITADWQNYTIDDTSFSVPSNIRLVPTEATGSLANFATNSYEFKYGLLNTEINGGSSGDGSGASGSSTYAGFFNGFDNVADVVNRRDDGLYETIMHMVWNPDYTEGASGVYTYQYVYPGFTISNVSETAMSVGNSSGAIRTNIDVFPGRPFKVIIHPTFFTMLKRWWINTFPQLNVNSVKWIIQAISLETNTRVQFSIVCLSHSSFTYEFVGNEYPRRHNITNTHSTMALTIARFKENSSYNLYNGQYLTAIIGPNVEEGRKANWYVILDPGKTVAEPNDPLVSSYDDTTQQNQEPQQSQGQENQQTPQQP